MLNKILLVLSLSICLSTTVLASSTSFVTIQLHNETGCIQNLPNSPKFVPIPALGLTMLVYQSNAYKVITGAISYPGQTTNPLLVLPKGSEQYVLYFEILGTNDKGMIPFPMPLRDYEDIYLANNYYGFPFFSQKPISC